MIHVFRPQHAPGDEEQELPSSGLPRCDGEVDSAVRFDGDRRSPVAMKTNERIRVGGWGFATQPRALFERFFAVVDNKRRFSLQYGLRRRDVAAAYGDPTLVACGFSGYVSAAGLEPGEHELTLVGIVGNRCQRLAKATPLWVLATPVPLAALPQPCDVAGRFRVVRELEPPTERHDGRSALSIRFGTLLLLRGWIARSRSTASTDEVAILLCGRVSSYRLSARRRNEPEAATALGPTELDCGFETCLDSAELQPGVYRLAVEVGVGSERRALIADTYIEIMQEVLPWLPSAVALYRSPIVGALRRELPDTLGRTEVLHIEGEVTEREIVSDVFVRIDANRAHPLTVTPTPNGSVFEGLLALDVPVGIHDVEVLVVDSTREAAWRLAQKTIEVRAEAPPLATH